MLASVVVPARDAAATLRRTLACLAAQRDAPEFEVIVVDDGSRDGTAAVA
jgi:glycosyltransferase involved in cell wall biosynthesis